METATTEPPIQPVSRPETIAEIVGAGDGGQRNFGLLVKAIAGLAVLSMIVTLTIPYLPRSLTYRAHQITDLPAGATVVSVDDTLGGRFGDVVFTVPEPKGPGSRLDSIWDDMHLPGPAIYSVTGTPSGKPPVRTHSKAWTPLPKGSGPAAPAKKAPSSKSTTAKYSSAKPTPVKPSARTRAPGWYSEWGTKRVKDGLSYNGGSEQDTLTYQRSTGRYIYRRMPRRNPYDDD